MPTILFPTDFSKVAQRALEYIIPIAAQLQAKVRLLHVCNLPASYTEAPSYVLDEEMAVVEAEARARMCDLQRRLRSSYPELTFCTRIVRGSTVRTIVEEAHEADWIMMGTRGAGWWRQLFGGSIASRVVAQAPCPVLSIPARDTFHGIHHIIFASNYEPGDLQALRSISDLAKVFDAEIEVVHISTAGEDPNPEQFQAFCARIEQTIAYPRLSFRVYPHKNVQQALSKLVSHPKVEILAMCPQRRSGLDRLLHRSQTRAMAQHCEKAILALPTQMN
ncbi:MAG: universal stress protein [Bacteroidetes bacterium]|nr:MAG: universal stress protein [Bacteroidota bacterium]